MVLNPTLDPIITTYVTARLRRGEIRPTSARHITGRLHSLSAHFGTQPLSHLDRHAIEAWQEAVFPGLAAESRSAYLSAVRRFCGWLVAEGLIDVDPTVGVAKVRRPRSVPRAQTAAAVAQLFAVCRDDRDRLIVWLMVGLGLRRGEVADARLEDYDPERGLLFIVGKGGHERALPVPVEVAGAIVVYHRHRMWTIGPLIRRHSDDGPLDPRTIGQIVSRLFRLAGLKRAAHDGMSGHALRHTCASDVLDSCHDLRVVQMMLGHASLQSTQIYLRRANLDQMRQAMAGRSYQSSIEEPA